jgi:hypothetical protein
MSAKTMTIRTRDDFLIFLIQNSQTFTTQMRKILTLQLIVFFCFITCEAKSQVEQKPMNGIETAKLILSKSENADKVPEDAKTDFVNEIDRIEKSKFVRVLYDKMSKWRKERFAETIEGWIERFPEKDYQTETIIKSHAVQFLGVIVQLYIVPPTRFSRESLNKAHSQLVEIEDIFRTDARAKLVTLSNELKSKHPYLGENFMLSHERVNNSFKLSFSLDDDVNPFQRVPVSDSVFEKLKADISKTIKDSNVIKPDAAKSYLSDIEKYLSYIGKVNNIRDENEVKKHVKEHIERMRIGLADDILSNLRTGVFWQCERQVVEAYWRAISQEIKTNYEKYAKEVDSLVDYSIVRKAFDEHWKISQELIDKRHVEWKKEFDLVVASQPREPTVEYEIPQNKNFVFRLLAIALLNVILISLIIYFWRRGKKKRSNPS